MVAYLLLTHGKAHFPKSDLLQHPAARQQVANLKTYAREAAPGARITWIYDYARRVDSLDELPHLLRSLRELRARGSGAALMDDLRRLYAKVPFAHRAAFHRELEEFAQHLAGVAQEGILSKITTARVRQLLLSDGPVKFRLAPTPRSPVSPDEARERTRSASAVSRAVRAQKADAKARELLSLRDELLKDVLDSVARRSCRRSQTSGA